LRFCGSEVELMVDSILQRADDEPALCSATDFEGRRWLIVEASHDDRVVSWLCVPTSSRVVTLVEAGRAAPTDAVLHSLTGWVEVVATIDGHSVPDRRVACSDLVDSGLLTTA